MNLVIDCSFIMSSILPDEIQLKADDIYNQISNKIYDVFVPAIFYLECNNVLMSSLKKQSINKIDYDEYLQILAQLPTNVDRFCASPESLHSIARIVYTYSLTSYDASYLELAQRLNAKIATLDKALSNGCRAAGVESILF